MSILKLTDSKDSLLLANGSLNNDLTFTMQNIDVTNKTTVQLKSNKKKHTIISQQTAEKFLKNPEWTWDRWNMA